MYQTSLCLSLLIQFSFFLTYANLNCSCVSLIHFAFKKVFNAHLSFNVSYTRLFLFHPLLLILVVFLSVLIAFTENVPCCFNDIRLIRSYFSKSSTALYDIGNQNILFLSVRIPHKHRNSRGRSRHTSWEVKAHEG